MTTTPPRSTVEARAQAPVLILGRSVPFLDVQSSVSDAEAHVGAEHLEGGPAIDTCDYFDGVARPLGLVRHADGSFTVRLVSRAAVPESLVRRVNEALRWARARYEAGDLPEGVFIERPADLDPLPDDASFARLVCELDARFNPEVRHDHIGGRLHNFWHAITG